MKKNALTIILSFAFCISFSQNIAIQPKVDERTEFLSIVFRLAEAKEYMNNDVTNYAKDIDQYFESFKKHELITFVKAIRETNSIGFDAVMTMAINLELNQSIKLKENLSDDSHDKRWGDHNAQFIDLLNRFYVDAKFHDFYVNHQSFYDKVAANFEETLKELDVQWLEKFFGQAPNGSTNLILSVSNGRNCYGPKTIYKSGQKDIYAIMGVEKTDSLGVPIYTNRLIPFIIHELCHSYCNPIIDSHYNEMESTASKIHSLVSTKMEEQHYGSPQTMLKEMLVRACVIKYNRNCLGGN